MPIIQETALTAESGAEQGRYVEHQEKRRNVVKL
jgi:hypothetical protein